MWKTDFLQIIKEFIKFLIKAVWITLNMLSLRKEIHMHLIYSMIHFYLSKIYELTFISILLLIKIYFTRQWLDKETQNELLFKCKCELLTYKKVQMDLFKNYLFILHPDCSFPSYSSSQSLCVSSLMPPSTIHSTSSFFSVMGRPSMDINQTSHVKL